MKIHEYQAKELFRKYNVPTPKGKLALTSDEVAKIAEEFGLPVVVRAGVQVEVRGMAGGIRLAKTPQETETFASEILSAKVDIQF